MDAKIQAEAMIQRNMETVSDKDLALLIAKVSIKESIQTKISKLRRCESDVERKNIYNNLCFDNDVLTELRKL